MLQSDALWHQAGSNVGFRMDSLCCCVRAGRPGLPSNSAEGRKAEPQVSERERGHDTSKEPERRPWRILRPVADCSERLDEPPESGMIVLHILCHSVLFLFFTYLSTSY